MPLELLLYYYSSTPRILLEYSQCTTTTPLDYCYVIDKFVQASNRELRELGHGSAAKRHHVPAALERVQRGVDWLDWTAVMRFGHVALP